MKIVQLINWSGKLLRPAVAAVAAGAGRAAAGGAKRNFHATPVAKVRSPALQVKISRYANYKNLRKIKYLKTRLGDNYKILGRDKRQSPFSERNSPTKPSQPPAPPVYLKPIQNYLVSRFNHTPKTIKPGRAISIVLRDKRGLQEKKKREFDSNAVKKTTNTKTSLQMPSASEYKNTKSLTDSTTILKLPRNAVPAGAPMPGGIARRTAVGPFYQHGLTQPELKFLFKDLPASSKTAYNQQHSKINIEQQSELMRRILSISSGNQKSMRKFNVARSVEIFQNHTLDTGSAQVQAAVLDVKITAIKQHLQFNRNDKSTKRRLQAVVSKQTKMLQYLRRKDLGKAIQTCIALGIDPDTVKLKI